MLFAFDLYVVFYYIWLMEQDDRYSIGLNKGRPRTYATADELQIECDGYFEYIKGLYKDEVTYNPDSMEYETKRVWIRLPENPTITGLALYLGYSCRNSVREAAKFGPTYAHVINRARLRVEMAYESRLHGDKNAGSMFALKNMGWVDRTETTNININPEPISSEEVKRIKDSLQDEL